MLNYLLECHIDYDLPYLYGLKIQKNFRSLCTLVIKIHESCCSIFNELCFLPNLAADSLVIIPLSHPFVKTFFKTFLRFFRSGSRSHRGYVPSGSVIRCSLTALIVYHTRPALSTPFSKICQVFCLFLERHGELGGYWSLV